jgi:hypothetical protein
MTPPPFGHLPQIQMDLREAGWGSYLYNSSQQETIP